MTKTIFIDGREGTTGLQISARLAKEPNIRAITLKDEERKNSQARCDMINQADLAVFCLPDDAAHQALALVQSPVKILDCSNAHRLESDWVYGLPELTPNQPSLIAQSALVANPGCYAMGALALIRPLMDYGLLSANNSLALWAVSGYSGGGKSMIADYQSQDKPTLEVYALDKPHKHCAEIQLYGGLDKPPLLTNMVASFPQGMMVILPLFNIEAQDALKAYHHHYHNADYIHIAKADDEQGNIRIDPSLYARRDDMLITIFDDPHHQQSRAIALFDNLGKGAAGTAIQNIRLMLAHQNQQAA